LAAAPRLIALAALAGVAGCFEAPELVGRLCSEDDPCPGGLVCREERCMMWCTRDEDCTSEQDFCVDGACQPLSTNAECTDGTNCTTPAACELAEGASCVAGKCVYLPVTCTSPPPGECLENDTVFKTYSSIGACNRSTGFCEYTQRELPCELCDVVCLGPCAGISCADTAGGCRVEGFCAPGLAGDPATCEYSNAPDGRACTIIARDTRGVCRSGECVACMRDPDCDDGNPCTDDACNTAEGVCVYTNNSGGCEDGDACTAGGRCSNGECLFSERTVCDTPPGECFAPEGECEPATGACNYPPKPPATDCADDGNFCTSDACDGAGNCAHAPRPDGSPCRDSDGCTSSEACQGGACMPSMGVTCDRPPSACFDPAGTCDAATGQCNYLPLEEGTLCEDDGNDCTDDACDAAGSCVHSPKPNNSACDDRNGCTRVDTCQGGACVGDDPVSCTGPGGTCRSNAGACDPATGTCNYPPLSSGTACTADTSVCTADVCDGNGACTHPPRMAGTSCDDGNLCTHSDGCDGAGACGGTSYSCNDSNACTTDECNGNGGCTNTRIAPNNQSATQTNDNVTMRWRACSDASHYDVNIEMQDTNNAWIFYFTYDENNPTAPPTNEKTFYPVTCNRNYRFRVRAYNGSHGPWSGFFTFYFSC
jgi:hypothetical protein